MMFKQISITVGRNSSVTNLPESQSKVPDQFAPTETPKPVPRYIFFLSLTYLILLLAVFVVYGTPGSVRQAIPSNFGPLPIGIAWFGATGAVISSLKGIFGYSQNWQSKFNYWHYSRPIFGAVTGSVGALFYLVLLRLDNATTSSIKMR